MSVHWHLPWDRESALPTSSWRGSESLSDACEIHLTLLSLVTCIRQYIRRHDGKRDFSNPTRGPTVFTGVVASYPTRRKRAMKFSVVGAFVRALVLR